MDAPVTLYPSVREVLGPGGIIAQQLPTYESRPEQLDLSEAIEQLYVKLADAKLAFRRRLRGEDDEDDEDADEKRPNVGTLVSEAGTGTGKSFAYLLPAILAARKHGTKTIVSTAVKALQAQIIGKDIPFLQRVLPFPFEAALLKGRGNYVCLNRVAEITMEENNKLGGGFTFKSAEAVAAWSMLQAWLGTTTTGDVEEAPFSIPDDLDITVSGHDCLGKQCPFVSTCYAEKAKAYAARADIVVVNHTLLLLDRIIRAMSDDYAHVLPTCDALMLDEAHSLEDVASNVFGSQITLSRWRRLSRRIDREAKKDASLSIAQVSVDRREEIEEKLQAILEGIATRMREAVPPKMSDYLGNGVTKIAPIIELVVQEMVYLTADVQRYTADVQRAAWDKILRQLKMFRDDLQAIGNPENDQDVVRYAELKPNLPYPTLFAKPVDVSGPLRSHVFSAIPITASLSATLSTDDDDFSFWRDRVGCNMLPQPVEEAVYASPFDYMKNCRLYLPKIGRDFDPRAKNGGRSPAYYDRMYAEAEKLLLASEGRAFLLFASTKGMHEFERRISPRIRWEVLVQGRGLSRPQMIQRFKDNEHSILLGLKSFWEGVDVPGSALSLVIIDQVPFPPPDDPVWDAKCKAVDRRYGRDWSWFHKLAIPNAIIQLKQAFGRLIRTKTDRGVVALLDGRLTTENYGNRIVNALPLCPRLNTIEAVQEFYNRG